MNEHRIGNIQLYDKSLLADARKASRKVDNLVSKLKKKYERVSVTPEKDIETGKMYVDIAINNKKERMNID